MLAPWKKSYEKPRQHIKKQRHHFADKGLYSQSYGVSSSHVRMWELDYKEVGHWRTVPLNCGVRKTFQNPLYCKEIKSVSPKRNQPWIFIGRTDAEAEAPVLLPPDTKSQFIRKYPDFGKDWKREKKGMTEDEIVGWQHQLKGMSLRKLREMVRDRETWRAAIHGVTKSQSQPSDWTTTTDKHQLYLWKFTILF